MHVNANSMFPKQMSTFYVPELHGIINTKSKMSNNFPIAMMKTN